MKSKKALIIGNASSILDGGGINYALGIASVLAASDYWVDYNPGFEITEREISEKLPAYSRQIQFVYEDYVSGKPVFSRIKRAVRNAIHYDLVIIQSQRIPDFTFNRKAFILCDFPGVKHIPGSSRARLLTYSGVIANSAFTSKWIKKWWRAKTYILFPPVSDSMNAGDKQKIILSVGRFHGGDRTKNQKVLIEAFKHLAKHANGWELHLAGFVQEDAYVEELVRSAESYPVIFHRNSDRQHIEKLYANASIYWHACGFGTTEEEHPERMEHFGISTAEALGAGCIPVVFNGGGLREIIAAGAGFIWNTPEECIALTRSLIEDEQLRNTQYRLTQEAFRHFNSDTFRKSVEELIN